MPNCCAIALLCDWKSVPACQRHLTWWSFETSLPPSPVCVDVGIAMTTDSSAAQWLQAAGLPRALCSKLSHLTQAQLCSLMLSDFERFGIVDMAEKQQLFRALQQVKNRTPPSHSPANLTPEPSGMMR